MVECMSDNRNRTVAEVRHAFTKCGGNLGTDGSVAFLFKKVGQLSYPVGANEDRIMEAALEAGAEDILENPDGSVDVLTSPEAFGTVKDAMVQAGLTPESAEVTMRAATQAVLGSDDAARMMKLLYMLEDLDDVQQVYSNAEIPDEILAQMA
jgi:YebC/PmpR family DNA-binding regulatory protein